MNSSNSSTEGKRREVKVNYYDDDRAQQLIDAWFAKEDCTMELHATDLETEGYGSKGIKVEQGKKYEIIASRIKEGTKKIAKRITKSKFLSAKQKNEAKAAKSSSEREEEK